MPLAADLPEEVREAVQPYREHLRAPAFEHVQREILGFMIGHWYQMDCSPRESNKIRASNLPSRLQLLIR